MDNIIYSSICRKHTSLKKEKEPNRTGFWLDLKPKTGKECSKKDAKRAEKNCLFKMLKKKNRADTKTVDKIFKEGRFLNSQSLTFKFIITSGNEKNCPDWLQYP